MKKALSLVIVFCLCLSLLLLAGCKKGDVKEDTVKTYEENYSFNAYVDEDADILGEWEEILPADSNSDKTVWRFETTTTLNIIETVGDYSLTVGAAYNYNKETNELTYMILDTKKEFKVKVSFDGEAMFFTDEDGENVKNFVR